MSSCGSSVVVRERPWRWWQRRVSQWKLVGRWPLVVREQLSYAAEKGIQEAVSGSHQWLQRRSGGPHLSSYSFMTCGSGGLVKRIILLLKLLLDTPSNMAQRKRAGLITRRTLGEQNRLSQIDEQQLTHHRSKPGVARIFLIFCLFLLACRWAV